LETIIFIGILFFLIIIGYSLYTLINKTWLFYVRRVVFPRIVYKKNFAIGIFVGNSCIELRQHSNLNPVLTAADIKDVLAVFVADPFMIQRGYTWYMFFEILNVKSKKGEIGLAISNDAFDWKYDQIVLSERYHLSYPYVFVWENEYYMIPESGDAESVRLYKAEDFPKKWAYIKTIISGKYLDSSIFYYHEKWWLFTAQGDENLFLFYSDNLMGLWKEHPQSPLISGNPHISRPGGRVLQVDGKIIRFAQDDRPKYGLKVHAFEITELSPEAYKEKMVVDTLLGPSGNGWNARGMHHIDAHQFTDNQWIACVDGWSDRVKAFTK
jgi:hypothetical protein